MKSFIYLYFLKKINSKFYMHTHITFISMQSVVSALNNKLPLKLDFC